MPAHLNTLNIRGPFRDLDEVERALEICETRFADEVLSLKDITSLPSADKLVLLIQFVNGLKIKLTVFALDRGSFAEQKRLLDSIGSPQLSRVLLAEGRWMAVEWIEGITLTQQGVSDQILKQAVELLATIHKARIESPGETAASILKEVRQKLNEKLPVLVSHKILADSDAQTIRDLWISVSAKPLSVSVIHGDFSPDNLVIRASKLFSVDNEKIQFHVTDYDVCRAVSLWDEWNKLGKALFDSYVRSSGRSFASESLFFWSIFDLVYRISYRISARGEFNQFCIGRLRQILAKGVFR